MGDFTVIVNKYLKRLYENLQSCHSLFLTSVKQLARIKQEGSESDDNWFGGNSSYFSLDALITGSRIFLNVSLPIITHFVI